MESESPHLNMNTAVVPLDTSSSLIEELRTPSENMGMTTGDETNLPNLDNRNGRLDGVETLPPWEPRSHETPHVVGEAKSAENSPVIHFRETARASSVGAGRKSVILGGSGHLTDNLEYPPLPPRRRLRIYRAGNRTNKWVTREIAALEFLTGIRMHNEEAIRARAMFGGAGDASSGTEDALLPDYGVGNSSTWCSPVEQADAQGVLKEAASPTPDGKPRVGGVDPSIPGDFRPSPSLAEQGTKDATGATSDEDDDSDGGWLDQPHPEASRRGGYSGSATWRGASGGRRSGASGGGAPGGRISGGGSPAPARRLRGREAAHVRVPPTFRHNMQKLPGHGAAVVRQWEQRLTQQERLLDGRIFFSCSKSYPLLVSSVLHYKPAEEEARRVRQKWIDKRGAEAFLIPKRDWRGHSYAHLLREPLTVVGNSSAPSAVEWNADGGIGGGGGSSGGGGGGGGSGGPGSDQSEGEGVVAAVAVGAGGVGIGGGGDVSGGRPAEAGRPYRAGFLDDPAMTVGRHRHMALGDQNTGPVVSSVLPFVKPRVLKDELNTRFRENHPNLPPSLTLSKIRSVKRQALLGCYRADLEVATVALACVYFERLCLAGVVTKPNRRLAMAACIVIAYKFNEPVLTGRLSKLAALWSFIDQEWLVSKKQVLEAEFGVLVQLSFDLHQDPRDVSHHFVLLLKTIQSHAGLYLGEGMMRLHQEDLELFFHDAAGEEGHGGNNEGGGGKASGSGIAGGPTESPRSRVVSDVDRTAADSRQRGIDPQGSSYWTVGGGWLQRRPVSTGRWLAGLRGSPSAETAGRPVSTPQAVVSGWGSSVGDRFSRIGQAGQSVRAEARQRGQRLNKSVRGSATMLALGVLPHRKRTRRRMETESR